MPETITISSYIKIIVQYFNILYKLAAIHCLEFVEQLAISFQPLLVLVVHFTEPYLINLLRNPVWEMEERNFLLFCALNVHFPVIKLHYLLQVLVIHLVRKQQHLEEFKIWILPDTQTRGDQRAASIINIECINVIHTVLLPMARKRVLLLSAPFIPFNFIVIKAQL